MNTSSQIGPTLSDRIFDRLLQAIEEAKLIKSKIKTIGMTTKLNESNRYWNRLITLNREIIYLEAKMIQVRSMANRN
jgi:hypothetical protein